MTLNELITILNENRWSVQGFNGVPVYVGIAARSCWLVNERFGPSYSHILFLFSKGRAYMYYDEADWERMCQNFYKVVKSGADLSELEKEYEDAYKKAEASTHYDQHTLAELPTSELIDLLNRMLSRLIYACGIAHVIEGVTFGSEQKLKEAMGRTEGYNEMDFSLLCSPVEPSFLAEAQERLRAIRDTTDKAPLVEEYLQTFGWVQTTYLGPTHLTSADVLAQAMRISDSVATDYEALKREKDTLIEKYRLTEEERFVIHTVERCFVWQDIRKMYILQSVYALEPVFEEVSKRFAIELMSLKFATPEEITLAKLSDPAFKEVLSNRCQRSAFYIAQPDTSVFTGADFDAIAAEMHVTMTDDVNELKGAPASRGYAKGRVRICESVSDIDKFEEGDVLVASMTRPEYLPAMQKAIAFVTNEGGITCHAAIVSREMKKPCVIGTKHATQVLHDGDIVEVDANEGIVRIVERA